MGYGRPILGARDVDAGEISVLDNSLVRIGSSDDARFSWNTADANANEMMLQLPAGDSTNVPVLVLGQSIEGADLTVHNGLVDPRISLISAGAWTTGCVVEFRKARGSASSPTVCTTGDDLGTLDFYAAVAAGEYVRSASIRADVAGTIATTRGPGTLTFMTATDAAPSVLTTALTISAAQVCTFASTVVVQGATATVGVAGTTLGSVVLCGNTSGTLTLSPAAAAGTIAFILPGDVGSNGQQLATNGNAGSATLSWTAAGSLKEFKHLLGSLRDRASEALGRVRNADVQAFRYRDRSSEESGAIVTTGDTETVYHGVMGDDYPEVMHHDGKIFNPVSAFGELTLAVQAMMARLERIEQSLPIQV